MYLNVLFKFPESRYGDGGMERIMAVVRRLCRCWLVGEEEPTEFVAGGLYLLGEVGLFLFFSKLREMLIGSLLAV